MLLPIWWSRSKWGDRALGEPHIPTSALLPVRLYNRRQCFNVLPETHGLGCTDVSNNKEKCFSKSFLSPTGVRIQTTVLKHFLSGKFQGEGGMWGSHSAHIWPARCHLLAVSPVPPEGMSHAITASLQVGPVRLPRSEVQAHCILLLCSHCRFYKRRLGDGPELSGDSVFQKQCVLTFVCTVS